MKGIGDPDSRSKAFGITIDSLRKSLANTNVSTQVPEEIAAMVEFAKKIYLYGYYEYDFYALCMIYLLLLLETAIKDRLLKTLPTQCVLFKGRKTANVLPNWEIFEKMRKGWKIKGYEEITMNLVSMMKHLRKQGIIPARIGDHEIDLLRQLRNAAAHLVGKDVYPPAMIIGVVKKVVDFVNCLYDSTCHRKRKAAERTG